MLGLILVFGFVQEIEERSRRKSLFIRQGRDVWGCLPRQQAQVEAANEWLARESAEASELRLVKAVLKEDAAKAREDATAAREDAARAQEDLAPLEAQVKELEEDLARVGEQHEAFKVQAERAATDIEALK